MADKFMCVYSEMQALKDRFDTESSDLNQTAVEMQEFQTNTVAAAIADFKARIAAFEEQVTQTETDLRTETTRVCGSGYEGGEGWIGEQSKNFVDSVYDTNGGLAGCFNKLRQDMEEINAAFTTLEQKIAEAVTGLKTNVETVAGFCTENADFTSSMKAAAAAVDGTATN